MNKTFLLIDRNKRFSIFLEGIIKKKYSDCKVYLADNIENAVTILKFNDVNVLICEEQLEKTFRFQQFSQFKKINSGLQIIATASYQTPEFKADALCNGAVESVIKPIAVGIFSRLLDHTFEIIEILSKKSLLLQDIFMLTSEGQIFSITTIKSLITSQENRFPLLKGNTSYMLSILKGISDLFKLSIKDRIILELALAFYGVTFDANKILNIVADKATKENISGALIKPEMLRYSLSIIQDSLNWYKDLENLLDKPSGDKHLAELIAVIVAFASLTRSNGFSKPFDENTALATLKRFSGSRFDPTLITAISGLKMPLVHSKEQ